MNRIDFRFAVSGLFALMLAGTSELCAQQLRRSSESGRGIVSNVDWNDTGASLQYTTEGKRYEFDLKTLERREVEPASEETTPDRGDGGQREGRRQRENPSDLMGTYVGRPSRGRQYTQVDAPDGQWEAHFENWNLVLKSKVSDEVIPVTTDGNEHIHYGTASWVYGEELGQTKAMWWTADSSKILYYKFNDTDVEPFYLVRGWSEINTSLYPEFYAKAGAKNPIAELFVFDLASR